MTVQPLVDLDPMHLHDTAHAAWLAQAELDAALRRAADDGALGPVGLARVRDRLAERDRAARDLGLALLAHLRAGRAVLVQRGPEPDAETIDVVRADAPFGSAPPEPVAALVAALVPLDDPEDAAPDEAPAEPDAAPRLPRMVLGGAAPAPAADEGPAVERAESPFEEADITEEAEITEAVARPTPPMPAGPPASLADIARLAERFEKRDDFADDPDARHRAWRAEQARALLQRIAHVPSVAERAAARRELQEIAAITKELDLLTEIPRTWHRLAMGLLAARARRIQDEVPVDAGVPNWSSTIDAIFQRLTAHSEEARPGWVNGLSRGHTPRRRSWEADARDWLHRLNHVRNGGADDRARVMLEDLRAELDEGELADEAIAERLDAIVRAGLSSDDPDLLEVATPHLEVLENAGRCKTLRKRIRERLASDERADAAEDARPGWSPTPGVLAATRGKVAVIVGGDERANSRERIREAFGFAEVSWERGWNTRRVQSLRDRIEAGNVDFAIFLRRFINHKLCDILVDACKQAGVRHVWVDQGYGVKRVDLALRRALGLAV